MVRSTLLTGGPENLKIDRDGERDSIRVPSDIESTRTIIAEEIARLHDMNISEQDNKPLLNTPWKKLPSKILPRLKYFQHFILIYKQPLAMQI